MWTTLSACCQPAGGNAQTKASNANATINVATFEIEGRVLNARNQQPVARALVRLGSRNVLTDHEGIFHFPDFSSSSGSFIVSKPGYYASPDGDMNAPRSFRFPVSVPIELLLYPESILAGTAMDATGESMAHLSVVARRSVFEENGHRWLPVGQTQTASDGSFRIPVPPGVYSLVVNQRGRPLNGAEAVLPLLFPAINTPSAEGIHLGLGEEAHLELRPESRKAYQVTLAVEPALRGFPILSARTTNGVSMPLSAVPTRGEERNELRVALPRGTYTLVGSMQNQDGLSEAKTQVTVTDHDLTGVGLRFIPVPSLPVVIEADSSATSDNTAKLPDAIQLGLMLQNISNALDENGQTYRLAARRNGPPAFSVPEGVYRLRGQFVGQWSITSATCGGVDLLAQALPVSADLNGTEIRVRVSNQSANLTGSVTLNGVPGAAWVYLIATTPSATPILILRAGTDGTFFRPYLAVGSYRAVALERKIQVDFQSTDTINQFLYRLQSFSVVAGEQRTLSLIAIPERELPQ